MIKSKATINGIEIEVSDGNIIIKGVGEGKSKGVVMDEDGQINGDVTGNITVTGKGVTIVVNGDVTGNIIGASTVKVNGDHVGNRV